MKNIIEKAFLYISISILIITVYAFLLPDKEQRFHLILTGMNRARFYPVKARFKPYTGKTMGGFAAMATAVKEIKKTFGNDDYAFISLGTELSGSADAFFTKGEAVINIYNSLGINAMLLSNIDFSYGVDRLKELSTKANFPFIGSNIQEIQTSKTPNWVSDGIIINKNKKIKIGLLGITPETTPALTPSENIQGLSFKNPNEILSEKAEKLRTSGANFIILLTQNGKDYITQNEWNNIITAKPDICIMLDQELEPPTPYLRDGILVYSISSYNQTKELDVLDLQIETNPIRIKGVSSKRIPIDLADLMPDKDMEKIIQDATKEFIAKKNIILGNFESDYSKSYMEECLIGDIVTDAVKNETKAQIVLQNSGGIQSSIAAGPFTLGDLYRVLPFDNKILLLELKGSDILSALNVAASLKRGVLQSSGLIYSFEHKSSTDYKLISAKLENGNEIDPNTTYTVALNNFLAEGGDYFLPLKNGKLISEQRTLREITADYIKNLSRNGPIKLSIQNRIIIEDE